MKLKSVQMSVTRERMQEDQTADEQESHLQHKRTRKRQAYRESERIRRSAAREDMDEDEIELERNARFEQECICKNASRERMQQDELRKSKKTRFITLCSSSWCRR
jgi:hypothetical protein